VCNAEVAIETSGHCALKENDYLDDGTYAAVRIIGLLARERSVDSTMSLLHLIAALPEMEEEAELRMPLRDETLESTHRIFDVLASEIEANCGTSNSKWVLDNENLEGIRVSTGGGGFFMLRKSLHDPLLSLQVEAVSKEAARMQVIQPLLQIFHEETEIVSLLDYSAIENYNQ
jgi:phosphomannomutase